MQGVSSKESTAFLIVGKIYKKPNCTAGNCVKPRYVYEKCPKTAKLKFNLVLTVLVKEKGETSFYLH